MNIIPFMLLPDCVVLYFGGKSHTVASGHMNYAAILDAIKAGEWDKIPELVDVKKSMATYLDGYVTVTDDEVLVNGEPINGYLVDKILTMKAEGFPVDPLANFLGRLQANPSYRSREQLYGFLEYGKNPITADGKFLARKVVRGDLRDKHSGTNYHGIGCVIEMPRDQVDDDPNRTCSAGLHVYSVEYGRHFGGPGDKTLVVEVDPADVVSVPTDYNNTKMRVCRYKVLDILDSEEDPRYFGRTVYGSSPVEDEDDYEDGSEPEYHVYEGSIPTTYGFDIQARGVWNETDGEWVLIEVFFEGQWIPTDDEDGTVKDSLADHDEYDVCYGEDELPGWAA